MRGPAALERLHRQSALGAGCTPPPPGTTDPAAWQAYITSCPQDKAASYVEQQLGVSVRRYYHDGAIDYRMLALDLARKQSGLPISNACGITPADMSGPELEAYALRCGPDIAAAYVQQRTGIDPRNFIKDGSINWAGVGGAVASYYFGTSVNFSTMFNADGSLAWRDIAGQAGGIAAAAVCTAYGAGAIAPACGWLGNTLGRAIYDVGAAFIEFLGFGSDDDERAAYVYHPTAQDAQRWTATWFAVRRPEYCRRILAIRGAAITACSTAQVLRDAWNAATGEQLATVDMLAKLFAAGMLLPAGWAGTIGSPPIPPPLWGKYIYGDQASGESLSLLYDWQVATRAFGQPLELSPFDLPFVAADITRKYLTGTEKVMLFGFTDSSEPGGAALAFILDPDGGQPIDPYHTAPGQWYTGPTSRQPGGYVPAADAQARNTRAMAGSSEPMYVSIFDPRAEGVTSACYVSSGQIPSGTPEWGVYDAQHPENNRPISPACRAKVAAAWEAQFWVAPDKVQVAYNTDARFVAEHAGPEAPGAWVRSIQTAASAVRRELEERRHRPPAESTAIVVLKGVAKTAAAAATVLAVWRLVHGYNLLPSSPTRPATWLKK